MYGTYYDNDRTIVVAQSVYRISFIMYDVNYDIHIVNEDNIWIYINNNYLTNITIDKKFIVIKDYKLDIYKLYVYAKQHIKMYHDSYDFNDYVNLFYVINKLSQCNKFKVYCNGY